MRKGFVFAGVLIAFALSYLFYRSCKRDTFVIDPLHRVAIPDSSWLHGSINLNQIKKDIAWSTLLNGDFNKIFQTDTNKNTLIKILRSPDTYAITEQDNIRYFSVWKDSTNCKGLIFTLENNAALKTQFKSDSIQIKQKTTYAFRTGEGFWVYDSHNLLFVSGVSDSLLAYRFFSQKDTSKASVISNIHADTSILDSDQTILISGNINTLFIPSQMKSALIDSALISFNVMSNDVMLDIKWTYSGMLSTALNQSYVTHMNNNAALFCFANLNVSGIKNIIKKIPSLEEPYLKQAATIDPFLRAFNNNNLTVEFNGWKKIKSSYYTSVMNEEFETVLQKKDSSIIEPIFKISLEQNDKSTTLNFLTYLQKQGLVSKGKQQPFKIIYGNFDSELSLNEKNTFTVHNVHTTDWTSTPGPEPLDAALLITINPSALIGLSNSNFFKSDMLKEIEKFKQIETATLHVQKDKDHLTGNVKFEFKDKNHPLLVFGKFINNK